MQTRKVEELIGIQVKNYNLELTELNKLKQQFFDEKTYQGLLRSQDFAESLVTAKWLFDSMKKARAMDLTIIGMGDFKAVEQLLFELICLHQNEGRQINKDYFRRDLLSTVELSDGNGDYDACSKVLTDRYVGYTGVYFKELGKICYFFTELIMNQETKDGYSKKLILVIDDPVSSFDFENKVGIMSLLKAKVADIIKTNPDSQILMMTHDIQCLYDLQKIGEEVCNEYKRESNGPK